MDLSAAVHSMLSYIVNSDFGAGLQDLLKSISSYQTDAYTFVTNVNHLVIQPLAATILAIMLVIELDRISTRVDGDQKLGMQLVAAAMFKAAIMILVIQNIDLLLGAINEISDLSITKVYDAANIDTRGAGGGIPDENEISEAGFGQQLVLMMILFLPWLITLAASLIIKVVVFVRFAEIYVLTAGATLPLVFMGNPETKSIAIGYLRKYAAAVLQGIVLVVVIGVFKWFSAAPFNISGSDLAGSAISQIGNILLTPIVFIFLIVSSGRIARALVGE